MSSGFLLALLVTAQTPAEAAKPEPRLGAAEIDFFEKRVRPILAERCFACHSAQAKRLQGNLRLDRREAILRGGDLGPAAVSGQPDKSLLIEAVRYDGDAIQMPPTGKLPAAEIAVLEAWVARGLAFPSPDSAAPIRPATDLAGGREYWAFQPVQEHALLEVDAWCGTRIDSFILAGQRLHALSPSPTAERRVLIRRSKFDLLGLPPSPDEIDEFDRDAAPDAYERLIDRYLAAPQYGERWGRFWLDLARYCDLGERWRESDGQPWLYRDWVVAASNRDVPYIDFVRQQLAADLLPCAAPADNAALGFLGLSPNYWKELKLDHTVIKQVVAEEWEERIEAIGGTFLGLTIACARCHDHKFDPITTHDYYALAGVLASTRVEDRPIIAPELAGPAMAARSQVKELEKKVQSLTKAKEQTDETRRELAQLRSQIAELKQTPHFATPLACGVSDASIAVLPDGEHRTRIEYRPNTAQDVAVHVRGNAATTGPVVPRRFLAVLASDPAMRWEQGSGRRELAEAIVTDAAPLAARVIVNRIWQHHFGRGLVTTPSNFGEQGERPSHPELLDDLAARFVTGGWSMKRLHREIVSSAVYRQASHRDAARHAADPDNVWLWRMKPRRLEVEAWRDALLAMSGQLDLTVGGEPLGLSDPKNHCRTIYGVVQRRELADLLRLHDFPDPVAHSATREPTTTPLQQLFALNSPLMHEQSAALVDRLYREADAMPDQRIGWLYRVLFGRWATADEVSLGEQFVAAAGADGEAWRQFAHVLLTSNEFLFVD